MQAFARPARLTAAPQRRVAAGLRPSPPLSAQRACCCAAAKQAPPAAGAPPPQQQQQQQQQQAAAAFAAAAAVAALAALAPAALASEPLSPPLAPRSGAPPPRAAPAAADAPRLSAPLQRAPPLTDPAAAPFRLPPELALTADDDTAGPDRHWIIKVLEIGGLNILGVWLVQQALRAIMDTSAPVTLVKVQIALRETQHGGGLRERLADMRDLATAGTEGLWLALEETVNEIVKRQGSVVFADAGSAYFKSRNAALEAFKSLAAKEADRADAEESTAVVHTGARDQCDIRFEKPAPPAGPLSGVTKLFGGGAVDENKQEVVVVTLVLAARGVLEVPAVTNWPTLRKALQQVCGIGRTDIMAIEVLHTPESAKDYLSAADVRADYPELIDLSSGRPIGPTPAARGAQGAPTPAPASG